MSLRETDLEYTQQISKDLATKSAESDALTSQLAEREQKIHSLMKVNLEKQSEIQAYEH